MPLKFDIMNTTIERIYIMNKINKIFKDILKMPYYRNYSAVSGAVHNISNHEAAIEDVFARYKLTKVDKKKLLSSIKKNLKIGPVGVRNRWMNGIDTEYMPDNSYISQPCGTHNNPDFIVKIGRIFFIECKSSDEGKPTFNSAYAKQNYIYIFTSKKHNKTTFFMGQNIVSSKTAKLYDELAEKIDEQVKIFEPLIKESDSNNRGVSYYNRPMYTQAGNQDITDYFIHPDRIKIENEVMEFVNEV